jgi:hypothetical protein
MNVAQTSTGTDLQNGICETGIAKVYKTDRIHQRLAIGEHAKAQNAAASNESVL